MTIEERAKSIIDYINGSFDTNPSPTGDMTNIEFITSQITQACDEAIAKDRDERTAQDLYKHSYKKGFSDAKDKSP